jgi:hypothetical protein
MCVGGGVGPSWPVDITEVTGAADHHETHGHEAAFPRAVATDRGLRRVVNRPLPHLPARTTEQPSGKPEIGQATFDRVSEPGHERWGPESVDTEFGGEPIEGKLLAGLEPTGGVARDKRFTEVIEDRPHTER